MSTGEGEGPACNKFWLSIDDETESMMSGEGSHQPPPHPNPLGSRIMSPDHARDRHNDSVLPGDSASHAGLESPALWRRSPRPRRHTLRLRVQGAVGPHPPAPSGGVAGHRLVRRERQREARQRGRGYRRGAVSVEDGKVSGGYALSYLDDEGDSVSITTDNDLLEAIIMARQSRKDKVDLFVHDPDTPPVARRPRPSSRPTPLPRRRTPRTSGSAAGRPSMRTSS